MKSKIMEVRRTQLSYTALFSGALIVCILFFAAGCSTLYEPVHPGGTNTFDALLKLRPELTDALQRTGNAFGLPGGLAAGAAILALQAGAYFSNLRKAKQALADHLAEFHSPEAAPAKMATGGG